LFVANDLDSGSFIAVYALSASGNVAPIRTIQGALTTIRGPIGMAVDVVHNELLVANYKTASGGSITVFSRTASGNVAPIRTLQGALTTFNQPQGLALDLAHGEFIVANGFLGTTSSGNLLVFPRLASGNTAPSRQISGPSTALCNPLGMVLDLVNDQIVVANSHFSSSACAVSVSTYQRTAIDDAAPVRQIGPGPASWR
jgi:hypothetical protein